MTLIFWLCVLSAQSCERVYIYAGPLCHDQAAQLQGQPWLNDDERIVSPVVCGFVSQEF